MTVEELEKDLIKANKENFTLYQKLTINQHDILHDIKLIKEFIGKRALVIILIVFLGGYIVGTQHKYIRPYIGKLLDTFWNVKKAAQ